MSISCVSIDSVSCHVIILRVSVSVQCRGHPDRKRCTVAVKGSPNNMVPKFIRHKDNIQALENADRLRYLSNHRVQITM